MKKKAIILIICILLIVYIPQYNIEASTITSTSPTINQVMIKSFERENTLFNHKKYLQKSMGGVTTNSKYQIISKIAYVPIIWQRINDTILWALDFSIQYGNNIHRAYSINSSIERETWSKINDVTLKEIKEKVTFKFDERLFTLYAFMNYTGYDDENNHSYYPVRSELREELSLKKFNIKDPNYFINRTIKVEKNGQLVEEPLYYSSYVTFIHKVGLMYPSFSMMTTQGTDQIPYNNISDLGEALNQFYKSADINSMMPKYKAYHDDYVDKIENEVYESLSNIVYTLNIKEIKETNIYVNLLEAYHRGVSNLEADKYTGKPTISVGPTDDFNSCASTIIHEYLHQYVNPVIDKYNIEKVKMSGDIFYPVGSIYNDKRSIVIESVVRVLNLLDEYSLNADEMKDEVNHLEMEGFVFADETYNMLRSYNFEVHTLNEFLKDLMVKYTDNSVQLENKGMDNHPINKLNFITDERVFTLFAFLNMTGYSEGNLTDVGKDIQQELNKVSFNSIDMEYFNNKKLPIETYIEALSKIGPAPEFNVVGTLPSQIIDLPNMLKTFYEQANISSIFRKYKDEYTRVAEEYVNMSKLKLLMYDHNKYYNVNYDQMLPITIIVELQTPFEEGYIYKDEHNNIVIGDSKVEEGVRFIGTLYRKYVLSVINTIVESMEAENQLNNIKDIAPMNTLAYKKHGKNSVEFVTENLVYAVRASMIYRDFPSAYPYEYEERKAEGYTMVEPMVNRIKELHTEMSFEDIIKTIMSEVNSGKLK